LKLIPVVFNVQVQQLKAVTRIFSLTYKRIHRLCVKGKLKNKIK
jgi:hypothetical protein